MCGNTHYKILSELMELIDPESVRNIGMTTFFGDGKTDAIRFENEDEDSFVYVYIDDGSLIVFSDYKDARPPLFSGRAASSTANIRQFDLEDPQMVQKVCDHLVGFENHGIRIKD